MTSLLSILLLGRWNKRSPVPEKNGYYLLFSFLFLEQYRKKESGGLSVVTTSLSINCSIMMWLLWKCWSFLWFPSLDPQSKSSWKLVKASSGSSYPHHRNHRSTVKQGEIISQLFGEKVVKIKRGFFRFWAHFWTPMALWCGRCMDVPNSHNMDLEKKQKESNVNRTYIWSNNKRLCWFLEDSCLISLFGSNCGRSSHRKGNVHILVIEDKWF